MKPFCLPADSRHAAVVELMILLYSTVWCRHIIKVRFIVLFFCSNTKQDLGACDYLHDEELKKVTGVFATVSFVGLVRLYVE